jgi:hypothetical protein
MNPNESALYEGVGRFITAFAGAEAGVHLIARKLSRLDDETARAIFNNMRLADVAERVRTLLRTKTEDGFKPALTGEPAAIVEACLTQLGLIASRRHNLVHRATGCGINGLFVTNILNSKSYDRYEWETYTLSDLTALTQDCVDIFNQMDRLSSNNRVNEAIAAGIPAWRYKSAPPASQSSQRRKDAGSYRHSPKPSQPRS